MSQENVEVVRAAVSAADNRDTDAFIACLHPDVEWEESGDPLPGLRGTYRGREEVRRWFEEAVMEVWEAEAFKVELEEIAAAGEDRVFACFLMTARGRGSGAETQLRFWAICWFLDRKIIRRRVFWSRQAALEAAGLRE